MRTNTRVLAHQFELFRPNTVEEALATLRRHHGNQMKILAGGTDLLVKMKTGSLKPGCLLDLSEINDLRYIVSSHGLRIGTLTSLASLEREPEIRSGYSALYEAIRSMAATAVRNMATIGGNLCNASPAADTAPALIVLGATCTLASQGSSSVIRVEDLFLGPGRTILKPDELLVEIQLPPTSPNSGSGFLKMGRVSADIAKISVAVYLEKEGSTCSNCRIALGAVAEKPVRTTAAESLMLDVVPNRDVLREVARMAAKEIRPITDNRSTAEYRREVCEVMVEEAIKAAWVRAGGEPLA